LYTASHSTHYNMRGSLKPARPLDLGRHLMSWKRPCIVATLALVVIACASSAARSDTFTVTARDLQSKPFPPGRQIPLNTFNQITAANGTISRGRQIGATLTQTAAAGADVTFTNVNVDVNDPSLTNRERDPDRTIIFVLSRGGVDTATVPFIGVGSVAVDAT